MSILNIRPAVRLGSKAIIAIAGNTGDGKTYTALQIARGMVTDTRKIGFLDTENGRGSFYSDILDGPFMIGDLHPPFSPGRYRDAIKEFQDAGMEVLVIDSISHEWEGEGGCEEIAEAPVLGGKKMADWKTAKKEHKRFINTLLQCNMHVICCIRAREKTSFKNPTQPVSMGVQPVCEKNFMYEMMASFMVVNRGKNQHFTKIPEFLVSAFGDGNNYIGSDAGKRIIEWVNGGGVEDPELKRWKSEMLIACENGLENLKAVCKTIPKKYVDQLTNHLQVCIKSASEYDRQREQAKQIQQEPEKPDSNTETYRALFNDCKSLDELLIYGAGAMTDEVSALYEEKYLELGGTL